MGRQPAMDADVEKQATDGDTETRRRNRKRKEECSFWCICVPISCVLALCITVLLHYINVDAQYSVATRSVSGGDLLDPKTAGLTFDLALVVASRSPGAKACVNPGMFVEVFYRSIRVAATDAVAVQAPTCAGPRSTAELPVVARPTGLPVGPALDGLAAELRDGAAVFDFVLHVPARSYGGESAARPWVTRCMGGRVGGAAVLCDSPNQLE